MKSMKARLSWIAAGLVSALALPLATRAADAAHPTVVELFQSQGCSSCPPANANLMALADRADVLPLSFQVTYWDQLGWKDTFATPAYTARQWDYAHGLGHSDVWTPQVVVNGRLDVVGVKHGEIERAIVRGDRGAGGPVVDIADDKVTVAGHAPREPATVWLVRYDPRIVQVPIQRGENGGRTLPHRNVVRQLVKLGVWNGAARAFVLPSPDRAGLKTVVLVQEGRGGVILAAARA
jgi:hypothetical protein